MSAVDCTVLVVTHNSAGHLGRLLDSLPAAAAGLRFRCLVIDNASTDGTVALARARADVTLIEAGANLGYAEAINLGRAHADPCSSLLVVNPDVCFAPGSIARMHRALREPGVGIVVPRLVDEDGRLYPSLRREPSPTRALGDAVFGARWARRPGWLCETIRSGRAYEAAHDVAWAGGAVMLISAECDRAIGDWDRRFFLYSEETDFARRARRHGYRVRFVPTATARHVDGGSGRSPALAALLAVNRVRYYEKYHRRPASSLFRCAVIVHYLLRSRQADGRAALAAVCRRSRWRSLPGPSAGAESIRAGYREQVVAIARQHP